MDAKKTFSVSLTWKDPSRPGDEFYKYRAEELPEEGDVISVVRFVRGRVIRARVTSVEANYNPPIAAMEI